MRARISEEDKRRILNIITINILTTMDKMNISQGNNRINDYVKYLSTRTDISKPRLKKILKLDVVKLITLADLVDIALAIDVEPKDLLKEPQKIDMN